VTLRLNFETFNALLSLVNTSEDDSIEEHLAWMVQNQEEFRVWIDWLSSDYETWWCRCASLSNGHPNPCGLLLICG
jgi:hypothetical protein